LAYALNGTTAQFNVEWDAIKKAAIITRGKAYTVVGGEMSGTGSEKKLPELSSMRVIVDGIEVRFEIYRIDGNIYYRLRDVMVVLGVNVAYNAETHSIMIDTPPYLSLSSSNSTLDHSLSGYKAWQ